MLQVLSRVVRRCNECLTLNLPKPEFSIRVPPAPNPFTADRWGGIADVRKWRKMILEDVQRNPNLSDQSQSYGRVQASAVLFGGLVSRESLDAFHGLLPQWSKHADMANDLFAVTWTESGAYYRRWFPDALTAVLMMRLPQLQPPTVSSPKAEKERDRTKKILWHDLLSYLRRAIPDPDRFPRTLGKFLNAALLDLEVRLPKALTEYAAGNVVSHSLRPKAWRRVMRVRFLEDDVRSANPTGVATRPSSNQPDADAEMESSNRTEASDEENDEEEEKCDDLELTVKTGGRTLLEGFATVMVLAFDLAAVALSIEAQTFLPDFLVHDSPHVADLGNSI